MKKRLWIIMILAGIFLLSCKSSQVSNPSAYTGKQIIAGSGGGAAGRTTTWFILDNGRVFRQEFTEGPFTAVRKAGKARTGELFAIVEELNPETEPFDHPGNLTHFIGIKKGSKSFLIKWGEPDVAVPEKYTNAYNTIMSVVQP